MDGYLCTHMFVICDVQTTLRWKPSTSYFTGDKKVVNVYDRLLGSAVHSILGSPGQLSPHADLLFSFGTFPLPSVFL
jgi:hypothetical protein